MKRREMKYGRKLRVVVSVAGLLMALEPAMAERDFKGKRSQARKQLNLSSPELGAARDKYQAWQRGVVEGKSFYSTKERQLSERHGRINKALRSALMEDRISDQEGEVYFELLTATGEKAQSMRGDSEVLGKENRTILSGELESLENRIRSAASKPMDTATATPQLNRIQLVANDLIRFSKDSEVLSKGQLATAERKVLALSEAEERAKEDNEVSDREREKLIEDAQDVLRDLVEDLRG